MKVLLDTNIIIHRESSAVVNKDIGILFYWLDKLHCDKYIHPLTVAELNKNKNKKAREVISIKIQNYFLIKATSKLSEEVKSLSASMDVNSNDVNDSLLLNEIYCDGCDLLITEDKKIHRKAQRLNISERVLRIDAFLEKMYQKYPDLIDYAVLPVRKEYFGNLAINDPFFASFKKDYVGFEKWFKNKSQESAYVFQNNNEILAFLYLKTEDEDEKYDEIDPPFIPKRRLKIGTFKVILNGIRLGERFLKIIFDNAVKACVDEIYVTIFNHTPDQERLVNLLCHYGFRYHGTKTTKSGIEQVYTRDFLPSISKEKPKNTYPYFSKTDCRIYLAPIHPIYHTRLLPDSILKTESVSDFEENLSYSNAIEKAYISRSINRSIEKGDIIIFYRTSKGIEKTRAKSPARFTSVITTVCVVNDVFKNISDFDEFVKLCKGRTVFSQDELAKYWFMRGKIKKPFIIDFLYCYSFPHRITLGRLIDLSVIAGTNGAPQGLLEITENNFADIIKESKTNERLVVNQT